MSVTPKKKLNKEMRLNSETLKNIDDETLDTVAGGSSWVCSSILISVAGAKTTSTTCWTCPA